VPVKIRFISGLPRSGTTLLAAILRQNPCFHAGISTPLADLLRTLLNAVSAHPDGAAPITLEQTLSAEDEV
jgi:sulfotransferase